MFNFGNNSQLPFIYFTGKPRHIHIFEESSDCPLDLVENSEIYPIGPKNKEIVTRKIYGVHLFKETLDCIEGKVH